ncbi:MAG: PspC domain-containing protein [Flavobacteriales bacterium]|nr:PspC domain-containing protein [Flavobacteriales bacterium]
MPTKRLTRSNERMLAGVCGGIAQWQDWDPTLVRIGWVLLSLMSIGFPGLLLYVILWVVVPEESNY